MPCINQPPCHSLHRDVTPSSKLDHANVATCARLLRTTYVHAPRLWETRHTQCTHNHTDATTTTTTNAGDADFFQSTLMIYRTALLGSGNQALRTIIQIYQVRPPALRTESCSGTSSFLLQCTLDCTLLAAISFHSFCLHPILGIRKCSHLVPIPTAHPYYP